MTSRKKQATPKVKTKSGHAEQHAITALVAHPTPASLHPAPPKKKPVPKRKPPALANGSTQPNNLAHAPTDPALAIEHAIQAVIHPEQADMPAVAKAPAPKAAKPTVPKAPPPVAEPAPSEPSAEPKPDFDLLADNVGKWVEESGKAVKTFFDAREQHPEAPPFSHDVSDAFRALGQVADYWMRDNRKWSDMQGSFATRFLDLWSGSLDRFAGVPAASEQGKPDKRFSDPEWRQNPFFDFMRQAYMLGSEWIGDLVDKAESLDDPTRAKARFYLRQISAALSPSNFLLTNPELIRETLKQNGGNLVRGMQMLAEDIQAGGGDLKIRQSDGSKFALGVNMAMTPGKVVFRNDLMELIQYTPTTESVFKQPLLIVPPWINKFYVLDLNPEKSFIRWAVEQGLTVFVISWVNPDQRHAEKGFSAYMREGIFTALDVIETATNERQVSTIGYCVGGTLLAITLAYMAARGDNRIANATLFTAQVDFTHAGDLKHFADEAQIRAVEAQMKAVGYLSGAKMAQAFNMLRPEDLIWSFVVNNYLKGKDPMPFDLLAWNADATRMPAANHSFYLRNCYLENNLSQGRLSLDGQLLDLGKVTVPIYNLATREDHIAPALSVFEGSRCFGGPVRYVLAGSGHIAGVVSPPAKAKYGYWTGAEPQGRYEDWLEAAQKQDGSWWTDWAAWLAGQAPDKVPAREPGGGVLPTLADAPGDYVKVRS